MSGEVTTAIVPSFRGETCDVVFRGKVGSESWVAHRRFDNHDVESVERAAAALGIQAEQIFALVAPDPKGEAE